MDKAYMAALIDGEGTIGIFKLKNKENRSGVTFQANISITNTHQPTLVEMQKKFGGDLYLRKDAVVGKSNRAGVRCNKKCHRLRFTYQKAVRLAKLLLPYLSMKRKQAENVILLDTIKKEGASYNDHSTQRQFDLYIENRKLNGTVFTEERINELTPILGKGLLSENMAEHLRPVIREWVKPEPRKCKIEGCNEKHESWGYCRTHQRRIAEGCHQETAIKNICTWCQGDISGVEFRPDRKFCSLSCKSKFHRKKNKQLQSPSVPDNNTQ